MNSNTRDLTPKVAAFVSPPMSAMTFEHLEKPLTIGNIGNEPSPATPHATDSVQTPCKHVNVQTQGS